MNFTCPVTADEFSVCVVNVPIVRAIVNAVI